MILSALLKGLLLGFSMAAAIGPIAILCIRKTIQFGRLSGFFSGLGAALADSVFAVISVFGVTLISDFFLGHQTWIAILGGGFLIYIGIKTFLSKPMETTKEITHKTLLNDFVTTFLLTLSNPLTIVFFMAVFVGFGLGKIDGGYLPALFLVIGVFLGSTLWWIILTEAVALFRKKVSPKSMRWINRVAGVIIALFGILSLISTVSTKKDHKGYTKNCTREGSKISVCKFTSSSPARFMNTFLS